MTTVIAVETPEGVTFGWDSQITYNHRATYDDIKVFPNGGVVFGVSGDVRYGNILRYMDIPGQKPDDGWWDVDRYVTNELIPAMQKAFKDADAAKISDSKIDTDFTALIYVQGRVYDIASDLSWNRSNDGVYAIGSGARYALGALKSMPPIYDKNSAINLSDPDLSATGYLGVRRALEVAAELDLYTGGDLHVKAAKEILGTDA